MVKEEYNKEDGSGWIEEQFCDKFGNYIERLKYQEGVFSIYLAENNVILTMSEKRLREIIDMIKIFEKEELT